MASRATAEARRRALKLRCLFSMLAEAALAMCILRRDGSLEFAGNYSLILSGCAAKEGKRIATAKPPPTCNDDLGSNVHNP